MGFHKVLKEKFGFDEFRLGQEDVIRDVVAGNDTIAILPTGIGKSLCYQLPAYLLPGTVLIISPLVALMEDQVAIMKQNGEKQVVALNSFLSFREKGRIIENLASYKFIFISPEMLIQQHISVKLKNIHLSLIVIDEAHCISQWGFDFRPDYLRIGEFFESVNRPNILALTATADNKVIEDIICYLQLENPVIHRHSLDRPNISFSIIKLKAQLDKTTWISERVHETTGPGIIYVSSRRRADELSSFLTQQGVSVASYHAGMEQMDRSFVQEQFINGEVQWICATNAFGMGIHKDNIRQIIHEHLPSTIAGYIQEIGRAGRDGELSAATLLYSPEDEGRTRFIIQEDMPQEEEIRHYSNLLADNILKSEAMTMAGISETGKRVIDYYLDRMSLDQTIEQLKEIRRNKETQLQQVLQIINSDKCIRKRILALFDEKVLNRPNSCCTICGIESPDWLKDCLIENSVRQPIKWTERLVMLLG